MTERTETRERPAPQRGDDHRPTQAFIEAYGLRGREDLLAKTSQDRSALGDTKSIGRTSDPSSPKPETLSITKGQGPYQALEKWNKSQTPDNQLTSKELVQLARDLKEEHKGFKQHGHFKVGDKLDVTPDKLNHIKTARDPTLAPGRTPAETRHDGTTTPSADPRPGDQVESLADRIQKATRPGGTTTPSAETRHDGTTTPSADTRPGGTTTPSAETRPHIHESREQEPAIGGTPDVNVPLKTLTTPRPTQAKFGHYL